MFLMNTGMKFIHKNYSQNQKNYSATNTQMQKTTVYDNAKSAFVVDILLYKRQTLSILTINVLVKLEV